MDDQDAPRSDTHVPTRRFLDRYEARAAARAAGTTRRFARPARIVLGVTLIVVGILIGWLPGPGFVIFALPGAFLLASEVRRIAVWLDEGENFAMPYAKDAWARLRRHRRP